MRTFLHTPFESFSTSSADVLTLAARAVSLPTRLLRAPVEAVKRSRREALARAEFAALDSRMLADIGLRRAPAGKWRPLNGPC
jgi:uncharacterized protein YjiS (DUF1127 family)